MTTSERVVQDIKFQISSNYKPSGDQAKAIDALTKGILKGTKFQTLLGVTGSGKTFTMANVIEKVQRPTLILSHNKTLSAQLYREFKEYFPNNAVEYFVSYYDYYQPEAYVASTDTYIEKDLSLNDEIERMRLSATSALMDRRDVLIVATVSCIYGLGSPDDYRELTMFLKPGLEIPRRTFLNALIQMQYERSDIEFGRSSFRVRGDMIDIHPGYAKDILRVSFFGDEVEKITRLEAISGRVIEEVPYTIIYPAKHFVVAPHRIKTALKSIEKELQERLNELKSLGKEFEAHRLEARTRYDLEMIQEMGYCKGVENYSRHLSGRKEGERPAVLLDYFPEDFILFVDESHVSVPQLNAMYNGDRSRKQALVDYGFRLPSALDNRPLKFDEFYNMINQCVFVSATPATYELEKSEAVVEQLIRPTGLLDPEIEVRPTEGQIDDLISEIAIRIEQKERVLVTTLTKAMSEDLTEYLAEHGIAVRYLHSEVETIERVELLRDLRLGKFDVLVGINLLREGIDLPEVSLVCIMDADKVGFLRSSRSLIQTIGRAARNVNGKVIMYADRMSDKMKEAIDETERRRKAQMAHNEENGITPMTIKKAIGDILERKYATEEEKVEAKTVNLDEMKKRYNIKLREHREALIKDYEMKMFEFAEALDFENAAKVRDEIRKLQKIK